MHASEWTVAERLRVLLADDNPAILDVVKQMLQKEFQIVGALGQAPGQKEARHATGDHRRDPSCQKRLTRRYRGWVSDAR